MDSGDDLAGNSNPNPNPGNYSGSGVVAVKVVGGPAVSYGPKYLMYTYLLFCCYLS
jgi:hypothetical protein